MKALTFICFPNSERESTHVCSPSFTAFQAEGDKLTCQTAPRKSFHLSNFKVLCLSISRYLRMFSRLAWLCVVNHVSKGDSIYYITFTRYSTIPGMSKCGVEWMAHDKRYVLACTGIEGHQKLNVLPKWQSTAPFLL